MQKKTEKSRKNGLKIPQNDIISGVFMPIKRCPIKRKRKNKVQKVCVPCETRYLRMMGMGPFEYSLRTQPRTRSMCRMEALGMRMGAWICRPSG